MLPLGILTGNTTLPLQVFVPNLPHSRCFHRTTSLQGLAGPGSPLQAPLLQVMMTGHGKASCHGNLSPVDGVTMAILVQHLDPGHPVQLLPHLLEVGCSGDQQMTTSLHALMLVVYGASPINLMKIMLAVMKHCHLRGLSSRALLPETLMTR